MDKLNYIEIFLLTAAAIEAKHNRTFGVEVQGIAYNGDWYTVKRRGYKSDSATITLRRREKRYSREDGEPEIEHTKVYTLGEILRWIANAPTDSEQFIEKEEEAVETVVKKSKPKKATAGQK